MLLHHRGCVGCIRKELSHPEYYASRPCPPGTKLIPERPLVENEAFLNTFDCQEQPRRSSTQRVDCYHEHGCEDQWKPTIRSGKMSSDNLGEFGHHQIDQESWRPCIKSRAALVRATGGPVFTLRDPRKETQRSLISIASECQPPTAQHGKKPPHHHFGQVTDTFQQLPRNEETGELLKDMCARGNVCINFQRQRIFTDRCLMTHPRELPRISTRRRSSFLSRNIHATVLPIVYLLTTLHQFLDFFKKLSLRQ